VWHPLEIDIGNGIVERSTMAKKNMHSFKKYQKELKRKEKAGEKLARRQGRKDKTLKDTDVQDISTDKMGSF
jgi:peptide subunit release factor 1 (eRF1)